jgi:LacI family transcriptional regulator
VARDHTPSIRTVAERAGVSVATVSNVLNGKPTVSASFARRVDDAIRELGYVVDIGASRLRSRRSRLAAVVVPDLTNPMFAAFVSTLEHLARADGFDLVVVSSRNDPGEEADRLATIRTWRPAGLIIVPCDGALGTRLPNGFAVPTVVADRIPDDLRFDLVAVDNAAAAGAVSAHLADQGYRDALVVGTRLSISNISERWHGALERAGSMRLEILEIGIDDPHGADRLERRLRARRRPPVLFALDHGTALFAYRMLAGIGLAVPRDIAFASFDEMEWMQLVTPGVTAVRQPIEELAEQAWLLLAKRLAGHQGQRIVKRLRCAFTIRGSTPRLPAHAGQDRAKPEETHADHQT